MTAKLSPEDLFSSVMFAGVALADMGLGNVGLVPQIHPWIALPPIVTVLAFATTWIMIVLHEVAHAVTAGALTGQRVEVHIQTHRAQDSFALWRLDFVFDPGTSAHASIPLGSQLTRKRDEVLIPLAGPVSSLALGAAFGYLASMTVHGPAVVFWGAVVGACVGVFGGINLIPMHAPGAMPGTETAGYSDGAWVLAALAPGLARRRFPELVDSVSPPVSSRPAAPRALVDFRRVLATFDADARRVVSRAGDLSERAEGILTDLDLLAALTEGHTGVAELLGDSGATAERVIGVVLGARPSWIYTIPGTPISVAAWRSLEAAARLRTLDGSATTRPEHVLLALIQAHQGGVGKLLDDLGVERDGLRRALLTRLAAS